MSPLLRPLTVCSVVLLALAGCTTVEDGWDEPDATVGSTAAPSETLDAVTRVFEAVEPSVVGVLTDEGQGSGVIYREDGLIVTNHHVVDGARTITVVFADAVRSPARVRGSDAETDLAVLEVDRTGLPAATFAASLPRIGELAVAVGNPLGFDHSVTAGVVSGVGRSLPAARARQPTLVDLVQTDAAISPGSSGGALAGRDGRVIGITVAYVPPELGAVALGFAVPSPTVTDVVERLVRGERIEHPFLGITITEISPSLAEELGVGAESGALVTEVEPDTPASVAGLQPGDVIVRFADTPITSPSDFLAALRRLHPGDVVDVEAIRGGSSVVLDVTLGATPD